MRKKIETEELVRVYNEKGRKGFKEYLKDEYDIISNIPYYMRRMKSKYHYDPDTDRFDLEKNENDDSKIFMDMNELCAESRKTQDLGKDNQTSIDEIIKDLLEDRLIQLSHYVHMDQKNRVVVVDKTTMMTDGYRVIIH